MGIKWRWTSSPPPTHTHTHTHTRVGANRCPVLAKAAIKAQVNDAIIIEKRRRSSAEIATRTKVGKHWLTHIINAHPTAAQSECVCVAINLKLTEPTGLHSGYNVVGTPQQLQDRASVGQPLRRSDADADALNGFGVSRPTAAALAWSKCAKRQYIKINSQRHSAKKEEDSSPFGMRSRIGRQWQVHDPLPWLQQLSPKSIANPHSRALAMLAALRESTKIDFKPFLVAIRLVGGGILEGPGSCCANGKGVVAM